MANLTRHLNRLTLLMFCTALLIAAPVHAFTAESLDITVDKSGDASATFRFTLDGLIENAIPQSMLEEQLVNGLASSSEPPQLVSMDRSSATIVLKKFALVNDVPTGTEYVTSTMDFKKAEIALQNSAVSSVISADFSPAKVTVTLPDNYARTFNNVDSLPSITHTIVDPAKATAVSAATTSGAIKVSASPAEAEVWIDGTYLGNAPSTFDDISAGTHTLRFRKDGYNPVEKTVNVTAGKTLNIKVVLEYVGTTSTPASPGFEGMVAGIALAGCAILCSTRRY
ncbi:MAG: PEGA domain-containing protein [Methanoregula sp.]|jgi:hypothetical protein|nr:PEGA domain-containing protein [Methanoregula sp.]